MHSDIFESRHLDFEERRKLETAFVEFDRLVMRSCFGLL